MGNNCTSSSNLSAYVPRGVMTWTAVPMSGDMWTTSSGLTMFSASKSWRSPCCSDSLEIAGHCGIVKQEGPESPGSLTWELVKGHSWAPLQRTTRWCCKPNIKALGLVDFDKKILRFSYTHIFVTLRKTDEHPHGSPFDPRGIILTIFVEDHYIMLYIFVVSDKKI